LLGSPLLERDTTVAGTESVGERPLTLGDAFGAVGWLKRHQPLAYSLAETLDGRRTPRGRKLSSKIDRDPDVGSFELREQCLGGGPGTPLIALPLRFWGSGSASRRSLFYRLDFGARSWYTRRTRASVKPLILLSLVKRRGNPSLSATSE
jgi:hypothetical protein